ncbi:MAG: putative transposase of family [Planctomycetota bacterium]|nr:putative transposase of family [Planctomycetota bacterium]
MPLQEARGRAAGLVTIVVVTDDGCTLIADLFPAQGRGGQWSDHSVTFNGIPWRLRTGAAWRDLPEQYGPWQTVYDRFNSMRADGLLDRILVRLQAKLNPTA